jgi:hypothetical protein
LAKLAKYREPSQAKLEEIYGILPKSYINQYAYFVKAQFRRFQRQHPFISFADTARGLARIWHRMSEEQRLPYKEKYLEDARRFKREMHLYLE